MFFWIVYDWFIVPLLKFQIFDWGLVSHVCAANMVSFYYFFVDALSEAGWS